MPTAPPPKSVFSPPLGYMGMAAGMPKAKASAKTNSSESPTSSVLSLIPEPATAQPVSPLVAPLSPTVLRPEPPLSALESLSEEPVESKDTVFESEQHKWATFNDDEPEHCTPQAAATRAGGDEDRHGSGAPTRDLELQTPAAAQADTQYKPPTDLEKWKLSREASHAEDSLTNNVAGSSDRLAQMTSTEPQLHARSEVALQQARVLACDFSALCFKLKARGG